MTPRTLLAILLFAAAPASAGTTAPLTPAGPPGTKAGVDWAAKYKDAKTHAAEAYINGTPVQEPLEAPLIMDLNRP
jgi:hypothetical protein